MTKEEILNYVMDTPENTNRMVLNDMLDEFNSSGSDMNALIVHVVQDAAYAGPRLDKTWQEIYDVMSVGGTVVVCMEEFNFAAQILTATYDGEFFNVIWGVNENGVNVWSTAGTTGYPEGQP